MIYDPSRHEPLRALPWDEARVREAICAIIADAEQHFSDTRFWPTHPLDKERAPWLTPFYFGAIGMVWGLHYLQDLGAARLSREYRSLLPHLAAANRHWLGADYEASKASYLMGDTPHRMMTYLRAVQDRSLSEPLETLILGNIDHPTRELMWGAPGTLLAALLLHERTQDARWADAFRASAAQLWSQLQWSQEDGCHYWTQDLYGQHSTYLDAVHGFVATASPLIRGRALLTCEQWQGWRERIIRTVLRTATWEDQQVNWRVHLRVPAGARPRWQMQFCHGAPGFVICLGDLPGAELDALLHAAGETIWSAGPLIKGSNLCHGTGGNGYAFLKLHRRTGEPRWLERARAFAMHGIAQTDADRVRYGQGRYSLWTGDIGFAAFLWDCLHGSADFPTLDVF